MNNQWRTQKPSVLEHRNQNPEANPTFSAAPGGPHLRQRPVQRRSPSFLIQVRRTEELEHVLLTGDARGRMHALVVRISHTHLTVCLRSNSATWFCTNWPSAIDDPRNINPALGSPRAENCVRDDREAGP